MAFDRNRCAFTETDINRYVPAVSGVYGIYGRNGLLYVGETNDMERRLLEHLSEPGTCIQRLGPTSCGWEEVASSGRVSRQNELILQLKPACNQRLG